MSSFLYSSVQFRSVFSLQKPKWETLSWNRGFCHHRESVLNHSLAAWSCGCPLQCPTLLGPWIPLLIGWLLIKPFHWLPLPSLITLTPMQSSREIWIYLEIDLVPCYLVSSYMFKDLSKTQQKTLNTPNNVSEISYHIVHTTSTRDPQPVSSTILATIQ